jgi:hypothetical protein
MCLCGHNRECDHFRAGATSHASGCSYGRMHAGGEIWANQRKQMYSLKVILYHRKSVVSCSIWEPFVVFMGIRTWPPLSTCSRPSSVMGLVRIARAHQYSRSESTILLLKCIGIHGIESLHTAHMLLCFRFSSYFRQDLCWGSSRCSLQGTLQHKQEGIHGLERGNCYNLMTQRYIPEKIGWGVGGRIPIKQTGFSICHSLATFLCKILTNPAIPVQENYHYNRPCMFVQASLCTDLSRERESIGNTGTNLKIKYWFRRGKVRPNRSMIYCTMLWHPLSATRRSLGGLGSSCRVFGSDMTDRRKIRLRLLSLGFRDEDWLISRRGMPKWRHANAA